MLSNEASKRRIHWYRSPIDRELLAQLNRRSDWLGLLQTGGHLGLLCLTGGGAWYAATQQAWLWMVALLFLHGTFFAFLVNAFHELCHGTVFRTKWLNTFFLYFISFIAGFNPIHFWTSHQEHHKYTLHPPDDLEVVLPHVVTVKGWLKTAFLNPWGIKGRWKGWLRLARGRLEGEWEHILFPESKPELRRQLFTWTRILLIGHGAILAVSIYMGWWMLPIITTFAPFYGTWLQSLCNHTQHMGLQDDVADFRLCTRTIRLNPFLTFLYWHMNYHIEHHMFAAVPCYRLAKLHKAIQHDLPPTPVGLIATWRQIAEIVRKQKADPGYQYVPPLPDAASVAQ